MSKFAAPKLQAIFRSFHAQHIAQRPISRASYVLEIALNGTGNDVKFRNFLDAGSLVCLWAADNEACTARCRIQAAPTLYRRFSLI